MPAAEIGRISHLSYDASNINVSRKIAFPISLEGKNKQ